MGGGGFLKISYLTRDDSFENVKHYFVYWICDCAIWHFVIWHVQISNIISYVVSAWADINIFKFGTWWVIRKCQTLFRKLKMRGRILTFSNLARDESFENVKRKKYNLIWCECLCANWKEQIQIRKMTSWRHRFVAKNSNKTQILKMKCRMHMKTANQISSRNLWFLIKFKFVFYFWNLNSSLFIIKFYKKKLI